MWEGVPPWFLYLGLALGKTCGKAWELGLLSDPQDFPEERMHLRAPSGAVKAMQAGQPCGRGRLSAAQYG